MDVFAIRHGETAWSLSGQHTGTTDIPLTDAGRRLAKRIRPVLATRAFGLVLCNPLQRARETCTPEQIEEMAPGWLIFRDGCPGGETPEHVSMRVDRVIARSRAVEGDTALFAHGHVLRVFVARWIGLPPGGGQHFLLNTGTPCVMGYYRKIPDLERTSPRLDRSEGGCALRSLDNRRAIHAAAREQTHQP